VNETILIVDDEYTNQFLLENILSEYRVVSVENGTAMWAYLKENVPDMILLDIMLGREDGLELAKRVSQRDDLADVPIVFVTAKNAGSDIKAAFEAGGYDFITKPFDETVLKARIELTLQKKKNEFELKKMSITDPLTGLYNRRYFFHRLHKHIEYYKRHTGNLSIAMLDLDHFKKINDTYGHQAGDYILQAFSDTVAKFIRPYDTAARFGGEEFIVLFMDCGKRKSKEIVTRIHGIVTGQKYLFEDFEIDFSFSCGLSDETDIDGAELNAETLIRIADMRLLKAKSSGRSMIVDSG
jgi:two-component system cell cycle response regulator